MGLLCLYQITRSCVVTITSLTLVLQSPLSVSVLWGSSWPRPLHRVTDLITCRCYNQVIFHHFHLRPHPEYVLIQTKTKRMVQRECRVNYCKWGQGSVVAKWPVLCVCRVETGEGGGRLLSLVYSWGVSRKMPPLIAETRSMSRPLSLLYTHSELSVWAVSKWFLSHIKLENALPHILKWVYHTSRLSRCCYCFHQKCLFWLYMCTFSS